jgi:subtilase family serine protease
VNASDLANFRSAAGLPVKTITTVIPPGDTDPGLQFSSGDETESDLGLEWAGVNTVKIAVTVP